MEVNIFIKHLMKHYQISIISKNKKSLENFLNLFFDLLENFNSIDRYFQKPKKRKILTILKSPHVNKRAQEQFQSDVYAKSINLYLQQYLILLVLIKKISLNLILDVRIKIKFPVSSQISKKTEIKIFNPDNFKLNFLNVRNHFNKKNKKKRKKITNYKPVKKLINPQTEKKIIPILQVFDIYGELYMKQKHKSYLKFG